MTTDKSAPQPGRTPVFATRNGLNASLRSGYQRSHGRLTADQLRMVGARRREAEAKLEERLKQAIHAPRSSTTAAPEATSED
jgi:hypothetical protein